MKKKDKEETNGILCYRWRGRGREGGMGSRGRVGEKERKGSGKREEGGRIEGERRERDNDEIGIQCRSHWAEEGEGGA